MDDCPWQPPEVYQPNSVAIPAEFAGRMSPWVKGFVDASSEEARNMLCERWEALPLSDLKSLATVFNGFTFRNIADYEPGGSVRFSNGTAQFFLPAPPCENAIRERILSLGLKGVVGLSEFLVGFGGLAESIDCAGSFRYLEEWPVLGGDPQIGNYGLPWNEEIEGFKEWAGSLMLYHAANGGIILVSQAGDVAWKVLQEHRIVRIASTFLEFIQQYGEHWTAGGNTFDPYSQPHPI